MLAMSKGALTAAQAETYYKEKYSQDDYYSEKQQVVGQWFGHGAEELGLSGEVASEHFRAVLRGMHPASGEVLVRKANGYHDRRAGWDATFNAPKSVSIQSLAGGDEGLIEAHRNAVSRALGKLEHYALSRRRGGSEWVVTGNVVAARFDHVAARPASSVEDGYGPDPHLHTHVVIANMTRRPDGEWRGLDPVEIYRTQNMATAIYRSELAREVQQLGYEIRVAGHDGRWELDGYTREQVMAFSRRVRTSKGRLRVKAWPAPRRRRTSRIARGSPRIIATKGVSGRNGGHARRSTGLMSSTTSHNRANATPSNFDIRKRRKRPFARVSTKTASAKRSLIAVHSKQRLYSTRWGRRIFIGYALRVSDSGKTAG